MTKPLAMVGMEAVQGIGPLSGKRGFFDCDECPQSCGHPIDFNLSVPPASVSIDARAPAGVVPGDASIARVLALRTGPQVVESTISPVSVDMVNAGRVFASHDLPNYTMGEIENVVDCAVPVAVGHGTVERGLPGKLAVPYRHATRRWIPTIREVFQGALSPCQRASFGVIFQKFAQAFHGRKGLRLHAALIPSYGAAFKFAEALR